MCTLKEGQQMVDQRRRVRNCLSRRPENKGYRRMIYRTLFFDVLSLPGLCSFGNGLAEQRHELTIAEAQSSSQQRRIWLILLVKSYLSLVNLE